MITKTGEPCEVLRRFRIKESVDKNEVTCEVSLPRLGKIEDIKLCEIEPYSYEQSSKNEEYGVTEAAFRGYKGNKSKVKMARQLASETKNRSEHIANAHNNGK